MNGLDLWAAARRRDPVLRLMKRRALRHLTRGLPRGALICDLGCGPGDEAAALAERGFRVVGMDDDPRMLALARSRIRGRVELVRGSFAAPPIRWQGRCDAVLAFHAANHPPGMAAFARSCRKLLRTGGRAVFTTANRWAWQDLPTGRRRTGVLGIRYAGRASRVTTPDLAVALRSFRQDFTVERVEPLGLLLPGSGAMPGFGRRLPVWLLRLLDRLEARLPFRPFVRLADHALVIVRKR